MNLQSAGPILGLFLVAMLAGCTQAEDADIAVASYPATFLVEALVADDLRVVDLGSNGALHDFEPSVRDLSQLRKTDHLILWSEGLESWAHRAEESLGRNAPKTIELIALPAGEDLLDFEHEEHGDHAHEEDHDDHGHDHGHDHHGHDHGELDHDPHTWNDPLAMAASADLLATHLADAYPALAGNISARNDALQARLHALHDAFMAGLADCAHDLAITNHEAHAYLAARYGFELLTLHGLAPGAEPSPATIQAVIDTIQEHGLPIIFIEEGTDTAALRAIQEETGVDVRVLHTLETRPATGDYVTAQEQNLQELRAALSCL